MTGHCANQAAPEIGGRMPDGTVYAGISPDTHRPMFATSQDAPPTVTWIRGMEYACGLDAHGHRDWRVPTKGELNVLFNNRAAIGGFNESGSYPLGWYWSSSPSSLGHAWNQQFSDGHQYGSFKYNESSLRCVRG